jgi:hypothetical protein
MTIAPKRAVYWNQPVADTLLAQLIGILKKRFMILNAIATKVNQNKVNQNLA